MPASSNGRENHATPPPATAAAGTATPAAVAIPSRAPGGNCRTSMAQLTMAPPTIPMETAAPSEVTTHGEGTIWRSKMTLSITRPQARTVASPADLARC